MRIQAVPVEAALEHDDEVRPALGRGEAKRADVGEELIPAQFVISTFGYIGASTVLSPTDDE